MGLSNRGDFALHRFGQSTRLSAALDLIALEPGKESTMTILLINDREHDRDAPGDMPLLWMLRDILGMTEIKSRCGKFKAGRLRPTDSAAEPGGALNVFPPSTPIRRTGELERPLF